MINIVCTGKPGDGLLRYSYEHCCYLNSVGIKSQVIIIPNPKHTKEDYIKAIKDQYKTYENIIFDHYTPTTNEITLVLGRSMITLPYLENDKYTKDQLLTLYLLFSNTIIALYSENHPKEYQYARQYFAKSNPPKVYDLCDHEVYPNGVGIQYEKIINFDVYKPVEEKKYKIKHLFLGTNETYYKEIEKHIDKYPDHGIVTYDEKWINPKLNNLFAPISNILGKFETYVYTKPNFDPAPRLFVEFKWLGKKIEYLRDKNIKDGGMVYWNRPVPTKQIYKDNINILIELIQKIHKPKIVKRIIKKMLDVIKDVQRNFLPFVKKGWDEEDFPKGQQEIDISKLWIDESIQVSRDLVLVDKILKKFDPRKSLPIDCVKELNEDKYYIIDGQHRVIVFGLLGIRKIQVNIQSVEKIEDYYEDEKKILVDEIKGNNDDEWNEKNIIS